MSSGRHFSVSVYSARAEISGDFYEYPVQVERIPEAHLPCYVVEDKVNDIPVISIHAYDDTSGRYHRKVYDTLKDAVHNHLERTFIQGDGKSQYDVVQRLQKCEPLTNGKITALLSFEYVTVSKKKRVKL